MSRTSLFLNPAMTSAVRRSSQVIRTPPTSDAQVTHKEPDDYVLGSPFTTECSDVPVFTRQSRQPLDAWVRSISASRPQGYIDRYRRQFDSSVTILRTCQPGCCFDSAEKAGRRQCKWRGADASGLGSVGAMVGGLSTIREMKTWSVAEMGE